MATTQLSLRRLGAMITDIACWATLCLPAWYLLYDDAWSNRNVDWHWGLLLALTIAYVLPEAFVSRTLGKLAFGLVVCARNGETSQRTLLVRFLCKYGPSAVLIGSGLSTDLVLSAWTILAGYALLLAMAGGAAVNSPRLCIHDVLAGTMVCSRNPRGGRRGFEVMVPTDK